MILLLTQNPDILVQEKKLEKKFKHKNLFKSTFAYGTKIHRHICEIDQQLLKYTNKKINFTFNPHLLPTFRGILSSIYVHWKKINQLIR